MSDIGIGIGIIKLSALPITNSHTVVSSIVQVPNRLLTVPSLLLPLPQVSSRGFLKILFSLISRCNAVFLSILVDVQ